MIDWSKRDQFSEDTVECRCGVQFRSHAKAVFGGGGRIVSRKPCPGCGATEWHRASRSDPETYEL